MESSWFQFRLLKIVIEHGITHAVETTTSLLNRLEIGQTLRAHRIP